MLLNRSCAVALACALICVGALVLAQTPVPVPARDASQALPTGTSKLSGVVVNQDGTILARATVTITDERGRSTSVMTDDAGAFAFATLPSGKFDLVANLPSFLSAYYGQTKPGRPGVPLTLADAQTMRDVRLTLFRGGVVAGTVTDPSGQPAYGASVRLFQRRFRADGPWWAFVLNLPATVDDLGQYRIHGLQPGDYIVTASPRSESAVMPGSDGLVPTSFPGVTQAEQATIVTLAPGEQRLGTDVRLIDAPRLNISGRVMGCARPRSRLDRLCHSRLVVRPVATDRSGRAI